MAGQALCDAAYLGDLAMLRAELRRLGRRHVDSRGRGGCFALHHAASPGHTACLEALLAAGASVHSVNTHGSTPLHSASAGGQAACVRALIAAGSDVNHASQSGRTPFSLAVYNGHRRVLKILLRAGADMNPQNLARGERNASTWALVDEIRAAGGWPNYVRRRALALVPVSLPEVLRIDIASFVEAPGGD